MESCWLLHKCYFEHPVYLSLLLIYGHNLDLLFIWKVSLVSHHATTITHQSTRYYAYCHTECYHCCGIGSVLVISNPNTPRKGTQRNNLTDFGIVVLCASPRHLLGRWSIPFHYFLNCRSQKSLQEVEPFFPYYKFLRLLQSPMRQSVIRSQHIFTRPLVPLFLPQNNC